MKLKRLAPYCLALLGIIVAGCGAGAHSTDSLNSSDLRPATGSSQSGSPSSYRLDSALTYDNGMIRFDPPPADLQPRITPDEAYNAYKAIKVYANAANYSRPTIRFCLYTNYGSGVADQSGLVTPDSSQRPAWFVRFVRVPDVAAGGGGPAGGPGHSSSVVKHDIVAVVDDASGQVLDVLSDLPDSSAAPPR